MYQWCGAGSAPHHSCMAVHSAVKKVRNSTPWPPSSTDLDLEGGDIPSILYNCMPWLIEGTSQLCCLDTVLSQRVKTSRWVDRRCRSLAQVIIYATHQGRVKPPKHVALPIAVWHITDSAKLVTLLNRFGHGMSYSELEQLNTARAEYCQDFLLIDIFATCLTDYKTSSKQYSNWAAAYQPSMHIAIKSYQP